MAHLASFGVNPYLKYLAWAGTSDLNVECWQTSSVDGILKKDAQNFQDYYRDQVMRLSSKNWGTSFNQTFSEAIPKLSTGGMGYSGDDLSDPAPFFYGQSNDEVVMLDWHFEAAQHLLNVVMAPCFPFMHTANPEAGTGLNPAEVFSDSAFGKYGFSESFYNSYKSSKWTFAHFPASYDLVTIPDKRVGTACLWTRQWVYSFVLGVAESYYDYWNYGATFDELGDEWFDAALERAFSLIRGEVELPREVLGELSRNGIDLRYFISNDSFNGYLDYIESLKKPSTPSNPPSGEVPTTECSCCKTLKQEVDQIKDDMGFVHRALVYLTKYTIPSSGSDDTSESLLEKNTPVIIGDKSYPYNERIARIETQLSSLNLDVRPLMRYMYINQIDDANLYSLVTMILRDLEAVRKSIGDDITAPAQIVDAELTNSESSPIGMAKNLFSLATLAVAARK